MLKKILLCLFPIFGIAQISSYTFQATSDTFTPISGGTDIATTISAANFLGDNTTSTPIPIGFTFNFNGIDYSQVVAASDGFISFNLSATSTWNNSLSTTTVNRRPILAPLWDDLNGNGGSAKYITTGTSGSQIFTIEYLNWKWIYTASTAVISYQIKLYEGSNKIEFVYRQEAGTVNSGSASIGIAGANLVANNFLSLNNSSANPTASSSTETTTISTKPASGQVYTFSPPVPCSGAPQAGTASASVSSTSCAGMPTTLSLVGQSTGIGITYQWQSATVSGGTFTDIPGATGAICIVNPLQTTYYKCIVTCSNSSSTTSNEVNITVSSTPLTVPYEESFEGITVQNELPSCWSISNSSRCRTDLSNGTWNSFPRTGTKYAYFRYGSGSAGDYFYTKEIQLNAGTTYKASVWYVADGATGFTEFSMLYGSFPSPNGLVNIVSAPLTSGNITNTTYMELSANFTVPTSGIYFIALHSKSNSNPWNLSFDDFSIQDLTPPPPTAEPQSFCLNGTVADLIAIGTDLKWYSTETGGTALASTTPLVTGNYYVSQTINGFESTRIIVVVTVNPQPNQPTIACYQTATFNTTTCSWDITGTQPTTPSGNATQSLPNTSATVANISITPINVIWYASEVDALANTNPLTSATVLTNGATYYAVNIVNGCSSTPFAVSITVTLSNDDFDTTNFSYYPNPTSNLVNIEYYKNIESVSLFNIVGQTLFENKTNNTTIQVDLCKLPTATYFVKIKADGKEKIIRIIKD